MKKKTNINNYLWLIVVYVKYIFLPLKLIGSTTVIEYSIVAIAVLTSIIINGIRIDFIKTLLLIVFFFLLDYLAFWDTSTFTSFFISMFSSSLLVYFFTLNLTDLKEFMMNYYYFSLVTLASVIVYSLLSITSNAAVVSYMAIGNTLTFISIPICYFIGHNFKKKFNLFLVYFLFAFSFLFANRMAFVSIYLIYQITSLLFIKNKENLLKKYVLTFFQVSIVFLFVLNIDKIVETLSFFFERVGISSYSLFKLQHMLSNSEGVTESLVDVASGRDTLYSRAVELIKDAHFLPGGISKFEYTAPSGEVVRYPHNFLLELLINFGIFGILILFIFLISFWKNIRNAKKEIKFLLIAFFIFSFTKLLVSSSFWLAPSFWALLGFLKINKKRN
ncbi:O-antigen ligase family protein [Tetragenococcus halophilus]